MLFKCLVSRKQKNTICVTYHPFIHLLPLRETWRTQVGNGSRPVPTWNLLAVRQHRSNLTLVRNNVQTQFAASTPVKVCYPLKQPRLSVGDTKRGPAHTMASRCCGSCWGAEQGLEFSRGDVPNLQHEVRPECVQRSALGFSPLFLFG